MRNNDQADREWVMRKAHVQLSGEISDEELADWLDRAELYFFACTNRRVVPVRAALLWADIAVAMMRQAGNKEAGGMDTGPVSSIKRGDTTVQYATGADAISAFSPDTALMKRIGFYRVVKAK